MPKKYKTIERTPEKALSLIERKFRSVRRVLKKDFPPVQGEPAFSMEVLPFVKDDDSVTADLRIMSINPEVSIDQVLLKIHKVIDRSGVNGAWLSVGFYNPPSVDIESEEGYRRTQGMLFYRTHSRRWTKLNAVMIIEQARYATDRFRKLHEDVRPLGIVLRAWWNIEGRRPRYKHKQPEDAEDL